MKWSFEGYEELYEPDLMVINGGDSAGSSSGGGATTPVTTSGSSSGGGATTTPTTSSPTSSNPGSTSGGGSETPYSAPTGSSTTAGATTPYDGPAGSTTGGSGTSTGSTSTGSSSTPYDPHDNGTGGSYAPPPPMPPQYVEASVLSSLNRHLGETYSDNCDSWTKKVLDDAGCHVPGLTTPNTKTAKEEYQDITRLNSFSTAPATLQKGHAYIGVNPDMSGTGHMFIAIVQDDGSFTVGNIGGGQGAINATDSYRRDKWSATDMVRIFGGATAYVEIH